MFVFNLVIRLDFMKTNFIIVFPLLFSNIFYGDIFAKDNFSSPKKTKVVWPADKFFGRSCQKLLQGVGNIVVNFHIINHMSTRKGRTALLQKKIFVVFSALLRYMQHKG
jgi:hypothetical protein